MRCYFTRREFPLQKQPRITMASVSKDVEKLEPMCNVGGNVKRCSCGGKTVRRFLHKSSTEFPQDPGILVLRIHTKDTPASPPSHQRYSQQPKGGSKRRCPETDERINRAWSRCTMDYFSFKRKEILTQAANMDEP